jgi:hypothetical protein
MSPQDGFHVSPGVPDGWDIREPHSDRPLYHLDTADQAQATARTLVSEKGGGRLYVHRPSGTITIVVAANVRS